MMEGCKNLSELFNKGFELYNELNKSNEATNTSKIQSTIKNIMDIFEEATNLVSLADLFSGNENLNEVSTENIKYFLLPALLGSLTIKICNTEDRFHILEVAETYFLDFLKRIRDYEIIDYEIPVKISNFGQNNEDSAVLNKSSMELITDMINSRSTKIKRFQEQKKFEEKLEILQKYFNKNSSIDDEVKREYFVTLIKFFANQAIDELNSINAEKSILKHMTKIGSSEKKNFQPTQKKLQPIVITRDKIQKKVYGAGYPSLPVLTVQEFYDQKMKDGAWSSNSCKNLSSKNVSQDRLSSEIENNSTIVEENEKLIEEDDSQNLTKMRAVDEYKDSHRRGWGNRANRS